MAHFDPSLASAAPATVSPNILLELVGHLGAALIQSDNIDPTVIKHVQSAHRLARSLRRN
jgi:hypothetical protein